MQMERHDSATCPYCRQGLWFGVKEEGTGWSVYYECSDCSFERMVGRIPLQDVNERNEVRVQAKKMGERL